MSQSRLMGAHVSAAGGVHNAISRAAVIGCNCVQVFSGSPRVWKRAPLKTVDTDKLFSEQKEYGVKPIVTHALYLVNLASDKVESQRRSAEVLKHDLRFDSLVKGSGVVVHLGSHQGRGWEKSREQVAELIIDIIKDTPDDSRFLIENSAGQKGKLSSDLAEIRWLLDAVAQKLSPAQVEQRLGWCLDTCHVYCAGYSLVKTATEDAPRGSVISAIDDLQLWDALKVIHVNDAKDLRGSGRDRHANLGDGEIPGPELKSFLNHPRIQKLPLILEVPGLDGKGPDLENVSRLQKLVA